MGIALAFRRSPSPHLQGSLMVQLNATYRNIEESIGRLLPEQTKEQLSLLEALVRCGVLLLLLLLLLLSLLFLLLLLLLRLLLVAVVVAVGIDAGVSVANVAAACVCGLMRGCCANLRLWPLMRVCYMCMVVLLFIAGSWTKRVSASSRSMRSIELCCSARCPRRS